MSIDREKALGAALGEGEGGWKPDDVILYHLGIGAGVPATDPKELEYTYERNLKVLPSFAVVARSGRAGAGFANLPGVSFNPALLLHGEQEIQIHRPLPTEARTRAKARIADIFDKGKAALLIMETDVSDEKGEPLYTNRSSLFLRGEGGFGGPQGPPPANEAPNRAPDGEAVSPTLPQQALLYRLNGDKNPLHVDPEFAKRGGFDTPIIHGLCSYGIVCKAVVDHALGGDTTRVKRYQARFRGVAFPGETYLTRYWKDGKRILIEAKSKERDAIVISNAAIELR
jgi:acyl dehydratase